MGSEDIPKMFGWWQVTKEADHDYAAHADHS